MHAAASPVERLALALAAVHAARNRAIRELRLDDVDIGNRRTIIAGKTRALDDLSRKVLLEWLDYRRRRWPYSPDPHLIINRTTAPERTGQADVAVQEISAAR